MVERPSSGGVLHVIVNNQIGFTTPPEEGRSTIYATDVARMLQVPIFHVNGEDPEAVAQVVQLAMDFRAEFRSDVFIDVWLSAAGSQRDGRADLHATPALPQNRRAPQRPRRLPRPSARTEKRHARRSR